MDFKVMSIFVEFYLSMLGFINYKLFSSLNISYPPTLELPVDKYDSLRDMNTEDIIEEVSVIQGFVTSSNGLWKGLVTSFRGLVKLSRGILAFSEVLFRC